MLRILLLSSFKSFHLIPNVERKKCHDHYGNEKQNEVFSGLHIKINN